MLSQEQNDLLTRTDRGTPGGEFMRRYWQPVAVSNDLKAGGQPRHVRIMGEDLVLFRVQSSEFKVQSEGRPSTDPPQAEALSTNVGLLGLHCSHRLVSLAYGRVEDGGIRCPFHGWLYDVNGQCLEQPAELDETFKDRVQHPSYPCEELGGLIFAYLGPPERKPLLRRYEALVREDGTRKADFYPINSNYLQHLEGAVDGAHFPYLHMDHWSQAKAKLRARPKRRIDYVEMDYGIWQKSQPVEPEPGMRESDPLYYFLPSGFLRIQGSFTGGDDVRAYMSWYVPADDTHTLRFMVGFAPFTPNSAPYQWPEEVDLVLPGPENDYFRDYEGVDTISGIPCNAPGNATKGLMAQDSMANETQGPIVNRQLERLGSNDPVLVAMRLMMLKGIVDVQQGRDPKHVIRDPEENAIVCIRGPEEVR